MIVGSFNAGTLHPKGMSGRMVCHCLVAQHPDGVVLVDTGIGRGDIADPTRLGPSRHRLRPTLDPGEPLAEQLDRGPRFGPDAVAHIVLTHLHPEHAGGLADFPQARVHVHRAELDAATNPTPAERDRYAPAQWEHGPDWVPYEQPDTEWFGMPAIRVLDDVLLLPTPGHSRGHCAVAVRSDGYGWQLHTGDAWNSDRHDPSWRDRRRAKTYFRRGAVDGRALRQHDDRLWDLVQDRSLPEEVVAVSAHSDRIYQEIIALRR